MRSLAFFSMLPILFVFSGCVSGHFFSYQTNDSYEVTSSFVAVLVSSANSVVSVYSVNDDRVALCFPGNSPSGTQLDDLQNATILNQKQVASLIEFLKNVEKEMLDPKPTNTDNIIQDFKIVSANSESIVTTSSVAHEGYSSAFSRESAANPVLLWIQYWQTSSNFGDVGCGIYIKKDPLQILSVGDIETLLSNLEKTQASGLKK